MSEQNKTDNASPVRNGRDSNGRFAKGNAGGPGNPYAQRVAHLQRSALAAVKGEDIYEIFQTLVIHAKAGRIPAIKLVLAYTLGKPQQAQSPDDVSQDELPQGPPQEDAPAPPSEPRRADQGAARADCSARPQKGRRTDPAEEVDVPELIARLFRDISAVPAAREALMQRAEAF